MTLLKNALNIIFHFSDPSYHNYFKSSCLIVFPVILKKNGENKENNEQINNEQMAILHYMHVHLNVLNNRYIDVYTYGCSIALLFYRFQKYNHI